MKDNTDPIGEFTSGAVRRSDVSADGKVERSAFDIEDRIYMDALETDYRLENWPEDDLEMFCGINTREAK